MKRKRKQGQRKAAEPGGDAACEEGAGAADGSADEREDEEEAEEEDDGQDLDVDFEFCDPSEDDYHNVSELLKSGTWEFVEFNYSELTETVVGQGNIGTFIKSSTSEKDPELVTTCGIYTALNLRQFAHQSWAKDISSALIAKAKAHADAKVAQQLQSLLLARDEGTEVALLFHERFMNLPPDLVSPLHQALLDDIEWSCTTPDCPADERPFYRFTHFVGLARCFGGGRAALGEASSSTQAAAEPPAGKRKKCRRRAAPEEGGQGQPGLTFPKPEDEVYMRKASFSFTFPVTPSEGNPAATRGPGQERRVLFGFTRRAFEAAVAEIKATFGGEPR